MAPHVAILMGTLNGADYLSAQLDSFLAQSHADWSLHVSDDGSRDDTPEVLRGFKAAQPQRAVTLADGPRSGSGANYLSLFERGGWPEGAWLALSDQDDVWMPDRLERAIASLTPLGPGPAVYASRTVIVDQDLRPRGLSRDHPQDPAFGNALTQNVLAGNTIVMNAAAAGLAQRTAAQARALGVAHHDWWVYLLMTGAGAHVVNDRKPGLYYRQHRGNLLGAPRGFGKAIDRFAMIWDGRYGQWLHSNVAALTALETELTVRNRQILRDFTGWLNGPGRGVLGGGLRRCGAWRQTWAGTSMLRLAAFAGRL